MLVVAVAGGVGCSLACFINEKMSKDRIYVNVIMSDDLEEMKRLRDFLAQHHITNVASDSYTLDWNAKIRRAGRMRKPSKDYAVPLWEKANLTVYEAAAYSGIGADKLRELSDREDCEFVLWNGTKRLIKRKKLDEFLERAYSI